MLLVKKEIALDACFLKAHELGWLATCHFVLGVFEVVIINELDVFGVVFRKASLSSPAQLVFFFSRTRLDRIHHISLVYGPHKQNPIYMLAEKQVFESGVNRDRFEMFSLQVI